MSLLKERVAIYCARTGDTRQNLAKRLEISPRAFYSKLNGEVDFKLSEAERLSEALGCSVDELKKEFTCVE